MQSITLEFVPGGVQPIVRVSQYDKTLRTFEVEMVMEGQPYEISSDHRILISGTKPDGKSFEYVCAFEADIATVVVTEQMSAVHGDVACELTVYDGNDNRISSANFILRVEKAAMDADAVTSETDIAAITVLVTEAAGYSVDAQESAEAAARSASSAEESAKSSENSSKESASQAILSESWAVGGTRTREDEDENNSRYYAEQSADSAKESAASAEESEKQAGNSSTSAETSASSAKASARSASDSEGSAVLSESWAIGGTGTREDEDENNSKYYAEQSAGQAEAAKGSAEEAGSQAKAAEEKADAAAESAKEAAASAANFDDTDTTPEIEVTDFMSMISADGNRYRKLVSDVAEAIIKKVAMTDIAGEEQTVQAAIEDVPELAEAVEVIGGYYTGGWKVTSSSAINMQVTESITLPAGEYIIQVQFPMMSLDNMPFNLAGSQTDPTVTTAINHINGGNRWNGMFFRKFTQKTTVYLQTGSSQTITYTLTNTPGFIRAIRLK